MSIKLVVFVDFLLFLSLTTYYFQSQVAKLRSKNPCTRQALEHLLLKIDSEMLRITTEGRDEQQSGQ